MLKLKEMAMLARHVFNPVKFQNRRRHRSAHDRFEQLIAQQQLNSAQEVRENCEMLMQMQQQQLQMQQYSNRLLQAFMGAILGNRIPDINATLAANDNYNSNNNNSNNTN